MDVNLNSVTTIPYTNDYVNQILMNPVVIIIVIAIIVIYFAVFASLGVSSGSPEGASSTGGKGLKYIEKVIVKSKKLLKINGILILEIGHKQKNQPVKMLKKNGFYINKVSKDLSKKDRCIVSTKL